MAPPAPAGFGQRTPEQIAEALGRAHEARRLRSEFLRSVRAGSVTLQDILEDRLSDSDADLAAKLPVRLLLRSLPGVNPARANRVIDKMSIPEARRVKGLGPRQRALLLEWRSQNMPAEGEE